ncbi:hypothetical protein JC2156_09800 [Weissella koreensis KCTC 3621]|nr:hypothetical protein JC2156_09800 [Weissella koreensis KCTC 3621]
MILFKLLFIKYPNDGRIQLVKLTEKGRREAEKILFYIR